MSFEVTANVLTGNLQEAIDQIEQAKNSNLLKAVQIDVIDGVFVDNHTLTPQDFTEVDFGDLQIDFHLMTEEPMDYVWEIEEHCRHLPVRSVFGQIEKMSYQEAFLEEVKKQGWRAGLALDLFTPLESLETNSWEWMDALLLLAVEAGASGQTLHQSIFDKISTTKQQILRGEPLRIFIDGGVKSSNVASLQARGADSVTVNSAFNRAANYQATVKEFFAHVQN